MQNRLRNFTLSKANTTDLAHFPETLMWHLIRPIDTAVAEPHNLFAEARATTVPDDNNVQVPVKHDYSETF